MALRLSKRSALHAFAVAAAALAVSGLSAAGCGSDESLVGGSCAPPFTQCGESCVNLSNDPLNCGACGHACATGQSCANGMCVASLDGASPDGATGDANPDGTTTADGANPDGATGDGGPDGDNYDATNYGKDGFTGDGSGDGSSGDGSSSDGSSSDGSSGDGSADACTPPFDTPSQCGSCTTVCTAPNNLCIPGDGGYACGPQCTSPDILCGNVCVDPTSDEFNCNGCGNFCPSFICMNSMCVGAQAGDVAVIGHDYETSIPATVPQAEILTNAVFGLRHRQTIRALAYARYADPQAVANVGTILSAYASANGRGLAITSTNNDGDIPSMLNTTSYDLLLVYDQEAAPTTALGTLGGSWQSTLTAYTQAGGAVVVLDGAAGTTQEMPDFITQAGLLDVTAQGSVAATTNLTNNAPNDSLGNAVASPYRGTADTAWLSVDTSSGNIIFVIFDATDNQPVVIHRTVN